MAENTQEQDSQAAEARKTIDDLNRQLKEASGALAGVKRRDDVYQQLRDKEGIADPYGLASAMARDVLIRDSEADALAGNVDAYLAEHAGYFTQPAPAVPVDEPVVPPPPSPYQGPNPQAPSEPATTAKILVGSKEWDEATAGMGLLEKARFGQSEQGVEVLDSIKKAHQDTL